MCYGEQNQLSFRMKAGRGPSSILAVPWRKWPEAAYKQWKRVAVSGMQAAKRRLQDRKQLQWISMQLLVRAPRQGLEYLWLFLRPYSVCLNYRQVCASGPRSELLHSVSKLKAPNQRRFPVGQTNRWRPHLTWLKREAKSLLK